MCAAKCLIGIEAKLQRTQAASAGNNPVALDHRSLQHARLRGIDFRAVMHAAAVVPQHEIADPPLVALRVLRLCCMTAVPGQTSYQRFPSSFSYSVCAPIQNQMTVSSRIVPIARQFRSMRTE